MEELGCLFLIPTFPRPAAHREVYTPALDKNALMTKLSGLERLDLQLIAMIEDARECLPAKGISEDKKVSIMSFSASGRFALPPPEVPVAHAVPSHAACVRIIYRAPSCWNPIKSLLDNDLSFHYANYFPIE
jgi:hypothetical protein